MHILKVRFRSGKEFQEAYARDLPTGGLFCPTTTELAPGNEVIVEVNADELPNKVLLRGHVKWWRPALPRLRVRAGALVEFEPDEKDKRDFVVRVLGGGESPGQLRKRKHTRIPIEVPVRYRTEGSAEFVTSGLREISVGGALLRTDRPLPLGTEVIVEVTPPGGVSPMAIAGKVAYHAGTDAGIKFLYRDGGGSRRLRELIRRIRLG
ncbi:MAG TPA: PilZ domain-containing protein [Polyangia bacterium]|nr:PilZ domain-containing protein [Polyangia bacterium]